MRVCVLSCARGRACVCDPPINCYHIHEIIINYKQRKRFDGISPTYIWEPIPLAPDEVCLCVINVSC
jgi:hypothetical protein